MWDNTQQRPLITGQVKIASTGTAVQIQPLSTQSLINGMVITAALSNNANGGTYGLSSVTNTVSGSGNGSIILPGGSQSIGAGVAVNSIWVNGTTGDIFFFAGS